MTNSKLAARLRQQAEALQKTIDAKRDPAIGRQNLTARRIRVVEGMRRDADRLELVQRALRRLAEAHDSDVWTDLPESVQFWAGGPARELRSITTRGDFDGWPAEALEQLVGRRTETTAERIRRLELGLFGTDIPGFFPTPAPLVRLLLRQAALRPDHVVLEPSAGKGDIADAVRAQGLQVDCVERHHGLREVLEAKGHRLVAVDCLLYRPGPVYDRVLMNPPFERGQDIEHIEHAARLLKPGGRLVAVASSGALTRQDRRASAFRTWLADRGAEVLDVEPGAFAGAQSFRQTSVNVRVVVVDRPAAEVVTCRCGQKNRTPVDRSTRCGRCGRDLVQVVTCA